MKRLLGKFLGIMLTVAIVMSLIPVMVVSAASDDARPFKVGGYYLIGEKIDFGDTGCSIAGHGEDAFIELTGIHTLTIDNIQNIGGRQFVHVLIDEDEDTVINIIVEDDTVNVSAFYIEGGEGRISNPYKVAGITSAEAIGSRFADDVDALPGVDDLTLNDADDVKALREMYNDFNDEEKSYVSDTALNGLAARETQINKLMAGKIIDAIDALPLPEFITLDDEDAINGLFDEIDELPDEVLELIPEDELKKLDDAKEALDKFKNEMKEVEEVIALIKALPEADEVTLEDVEEVYDARAAYDVLTKRQQSFVDDDSTKKLDEVYLATEKLWLEYFIDLADDLLEDYGDIMSDDVKAALEDSVKAGKLLLAEDADTTISEITEATDAVYYALWDADDELSDIYVFTEGAESSWTKGSKDPFKFRIVQCGLEDDAYDSFLNAGSKVLVDGEVVDAKYLTAEKGSVIITIIPEFLETLSVGEHTITINFSNSVTLTTKLTVNAPASVPATGESVSYLAFTGASLILLAGCAYVLRKRVAEK
jgi:predicted translin family RNA/ssDNA-binding protein